MGKVHLIRAFLSIPNIHSSRIEELRGIAGAHASINGPFGDGHFEIMWANQPPEFLARLQGELIPAIEKFLG